MKILYSSKKNRLSDIQCRKRIKILFLTHASGLSGSERRLLALLKGLNKDRYAPLILMPEDGQLRNKIDELGIRTIIYPVQRWIAYDGEHTRKHFKKVFAGLPERILFLCKLIDKEKVDLVYTNSVTLIDAGIAAKIKFLPHIFHIGNFLYNNPCLKPYLPISVISFLINIFSSKIILVSNAARESYNFERFGTRNGKIRVVHNGVDIEEYNIRGLLIEKDLRSRLQLPRKIKIVALVGRYEEIKGLSDFIKTAKIVTSYFKDVVFIVVGYRFKKDFSDKSKVMIKDLQLEDKIYFMAFRKNMVPLYQSMDILVSASWDETFGRTIVEAMAVGKPVVSTRCGGPEEIVVDGQTGFLVPIKSPKDLASAIIRLLSNPQLAQQMGKLGQKQAIKLFNLERYVSDIENIIDSAVEKRFFNAN